MLAAFTFMWNELWGRISTVKYRVDLDSPTISRVHSVPYWARSRVRDFQRSEIENLITINVIQPAQTDWASQASLEPEKNGTLIFCATDRKLIVIDIRNCYALPWMNGCKYSLRDTLAPSTLDGKVRLLTDRSPLNLQSRDSEYFSPSFKP